MLAHALDSKASVEQAVITLRAAGNRAPSRLTDTEIAALDLIYRRCSPSALQTARRYVPSTADAQDVVHDIFFRLPALLARYETGNFDGWLARVVARAALTSGRKRWRECSIGEDSWLALDGERSHESDGPGMDWEKSTEALRAAMARLPDQLRRIVELRVYSEYSHAEIAQALGITTIASEVRFCRARKRLRELMHSAAVCSLDSSAA